MKRWMNLLLALMLTLMALPGLAEQAPPVEEHPLLRQAFAKAAFRAEYDIEGRDELRRWAQPIGVFLDGRYTRADKAFFEDFIRQLNEKVEGLPEVSLVNAYSKAKVRIQFGPLHKLGKLLPGYVEGNWGYFSFWTGEGSEMSSAEVVIASDVTNQEERNHLLMEEFVGLLGLANDIDSPEDSIIYQQWTTTQQLSQLDWQLLNLLYDARLHPGMSRAEAFQALGWE